MKSEEFNTRVAFCGTFGLKRIVPEQVVGG
jgi:hypothetical protein